MLEGNSIEVVWTMSFYSEVMAKDEYKGSWLSALTSLVKLRKPEVSWQNSTFWQHFLDRRKHASHAAPYVHLRKLSAKGRHAISTEDAQRR